MESRLNPGVHMREKKPRLLLIQLAISSSAVRDASSWEGLPARPPINFPIDPSLPAWASRTEVRMTMSFAGRAARAGLKN